MVGVWARLLSVPQPLPITFKILIEALPTAFFYGYCFDIVNQISSVEEDAINKPYRPIVSGLLSITGAQRRLLISWILSPLAIYAISGLKSSTIFLSWEGWVIFCYVWPKFNHWVIKNAFTSVGAFIMFRLINAIVCHRAPHLSMDPDLDSLLALYFMMTIHLQEFHDMEGDRKIGRRTLPLSVRPSSIKRVRQLSAAVMVAIGLFPTTWTLIYYREWQYLYLLLSGFLFTAGCGIIAVRVVEINSKSGSERTYKVYYMLTTYALAVYLSFLSAATMSD